MGKRFFIEGEKNKEVESSECLRSNAQLTFCEEAVSHPSSILLIKDKYVARKDQCQRGSSNVTKTLRP